MRSPRVLPVHRLYRPPSPHIGISGSRSRSIWQQWQRQQCRHHHQHHRIQHHQSHRCQHHQHRCFGGPRDPAELPSFESDFRRALQRCMQRQQQQKKKKRKGPSHQQIADMVFRALGTGASAADDDDDADGSDSAVDGVPCGIATDTTDTECSSSSSKDNDDRRQHQQQQQQQQYIDTANTTPARASTSPSWADLGGEMVAAGMLHRHTASPLVMLLRAMLVDEISTGSSSGEQQQQQEEKDHGELRIMRWIEQSLLSAMAVEQRQHQHQQHTPMADTGETAVDSARAMHLLTGMALLQKMMASHSPAHTSPAHTSPSSSSSSSSSTEQSARAADSWGDRPNDHQGGRSSAVRVRVMLTMAVLLDVLLFRPPSAIPHSQARAFVEHIRLDLTRTRQAKLCGMVVDTLLEACRGGSGSSRSRSRERSYSMRERRSAPEDDVDGTAAAGYALAVRCVESIISRTPHLFTDAVVNSAVLKGRGIPARLRWEWAMRHRDMSPTRHVTPSVLTHLLQCLRDDIQDDTLLLQEMYDFATRRATHLLQHPYVADQLIATVREMHSVADVWQLWHELEEVHGLPDIRWHGLVLCSLLRCTVATSETAKTLDVVRQLVRGEGDGDGTTSFETSHSSSSSSSSLCWPTPFFETSGQRKRFLRVASAVSADLVTHGHQSLALRWGQLVQDQLDRFAVIKQDTSDFWAEEEEEEEDEWQEEEEEEEEGQEEQDEEGWW